MTELILSIRNNYFIFLQILRLMSDSVLKIGLLGCGTIAQFAHLPAIGKVRNARLTAICDGAKDLLTTVGNI
mgnify:CR=1 FL=1